MRRIVVMGFAVTALALAPRSARAGEGDAQPLPVAPPLAATVESPTATVDTVHLRSGGMFRGHVTEIVPGDHVTILVSGGASHRVTWADVERVVVASTPIPPAPAVAPPPGAVGPTAVVRLRSSSGRATLYRKPAGSTEFITACDAPCGIALPIGDAYKIGGSGITTTPEFKIDAAPGGSVELTVDGPSWVGIIGGGLLTLAGAGSMYVGLIFALAGSSCSSSSRYQCSGGTEVRNGGLVALGVGAAMTAAGLLIVYPSMKTDITQEKGASGKDAFVRSPTWLSAARTGAEGHPLPATVSLFDVRF